MGLLDLLLQNQSNLDINPVPQQGNGPVNPATGEFNTGAIPFQQTWDSNNTYMNSFNGGTNTGIQPSTLSQTGLDIYNPSSILSTDTPNTLTYYPATALGGLGQSALQFIQIWNPVINYNDVVAGADTSPLEQSLSRTGLDNTDSNAVPTTSSPINSTNYPNQSTGEYGGPSSQYQTIYTPNSTYESNYINNQNNFDSLQINTVNNIESPNEISNPTDYGIPSPSPQIQMGEFGGTPQQYIPEYNSTNTYLNTFPSLINEGTNPQVNTLSRTGLDNLNSNSETTTSTPDNISSPTDYGIPSVSPLIQMGEFGGAPQQYIIPFNSTNTYLNTFNPNVQPNTILDGLTGLDNTVPLSSPTTATPLPVPVTPQNLPSQTFMGEFNGAPSQFTPLYNPNPDGGYLNNYNTLINENTNPQILTLSETGLDIENINSAPSTTSPLSVPITPQILPPQTFMGEFNGVANQYIQFYTPTQGYLNNYNNIISNAGNPQILNLSNTGLDIENQNAAPTTYVVPFIDNITQYPNLVTGEFNSGFSPYQQTYTPILTYNNLIINSGNNPLSIIAQSLSDTGLDIENQEAASTTYVVPQIDNITVYPIEATGYSDSPASPYKTIWTPVNKYLNYVDSIPIKER